MYIYIYIWLSHMRNIEINIFLSYFFKSESLTSSLTAKSLKYWLMKVGIISIVFECSDLRRRERLVELDESFSLLVVGRMS